jgi:hypothetical protein
LITENKSFINDCGAINSDWIKKKAPKRVKTLSEGAEALEVLICLQSVLRFGGKW